MPRNDIWQDGIKTRFSRENQPANRGRPKGRPNRLTVIRFAFALLSEQIRAEEEQSRARRNAQRRERYRLKKNEPGEPPTRL